MEVTRADLPDDVMANLLEAPEADETVLTRWSHCSLTGSPGATLGRGQAEDLPTPEVVARTVLQRGDTQPADYLIVDLLGEGGMGIVFEAEQVYFGRRVALKMIKPALAADPIAVKAFFREAIITSRLDHPGIIPILDFGVSQDNRALYAMVKAGGVSWHRVMRDKTLSENLVIFDRMANIVAYAHRQGILHRDIKPANVLLGEHGEVWLSDWGVALARQDDGSYSHVRPAGTPSYMPPEMARCEAGSVGPASDIYLLGAVLFELITGNPPHDGDDSRAALLASASNTIHNTDQNTGLLQIAYKAMAVEPEHRFASVDDLQDAVTKRLRLNESVYRQQQADTHLSAARKTGEYELFQQAISGYDEAMALSLDNTTAHKHREQAIVEYARRAAANGEFDLAESIMAPLTEKDGAVVELAIAIALGREKQTKRNRRYKRQIYWLAGMGILLLAATVIYHLRNTGIQRAIEAGDRFTQMEMDTRRRGAVMSLSMNLPPKGLVYTALQSDSNPVGPVAFPMLNEDEEQKRRFANEQREYQDKMQLSTEQRGNRDRIIEELTTLLAPIAEVCSRAHDIKIDDDVTKIYQALFALRPQLQEKLDEVTRLKKDGSLEQDHADAITKSLTYLMTRPKTYKSPGE